MLLRTRSHLSDCNISRTSFPVWDYCRKNATTERSYVEQLSNIRQLVGRAKAAEAETARAGSLGPICRQLSNLSEPSARPSTIVDLRQVQLAVLRHGPADVWTGRRTRPRQLYICALVRCRQQLTAGRSTRTCLSLSLCPARPTHSSAVWFQLPDASTDECDDLQFQFIIIIIIIITQGGNYSPVDPVMWGEGSTGPFASEKKKFQHQALPARII